jgi:propanol-preferring alcohol dehydrogenase
MRALQFVAFGQVPEIREVPTPEPGPSEVLVKMTAAGVCHSDEFFMSLPLEEAGLPVPRTLGHEGAGIVAALGRAASGIKEGDAVAVYGAWGCGSCRNCAVGAENYCLENVPWPGFEVPGFMSDYFLVPSARHLVPLGDLDPARNVPLTDAGLTPYHAIKPSLHKLVPGSTAVVIGVGGLGHLAIQMLRALSPAQVIALDISDEKLAFAREIGAHAAFRSDSSAVDAVRGLNGGRGADAVFNFVGVQEAADLALKLAGRWAEIVMVALGPGTIPVSVDTTPSGTTVRAPVWGTRQDLIEVLDLARSGAIKVETEQFSLENGAKAYERLRAGTLRGRAVLVP